MEAPLQALLRGYRRRPRSLLLVALCGTPGTKIPTGGRSLPRLQLRPEPVLPYRLDHGLPSSPAGFPFGFPDPVLGCPDDLPLGLLGGLLQAPGHVPDGLKLLPVDGSAVDALGRSR